MKKKEHHIRIGFGSSILLLVFIVISFVSFAVLSLSSAIADQKITDKIRQKNSQYYEAYNEAQDRLAELDETLQQKYEETDSMDSYFKEVERESRFTVPVSGYQELLVQVRHLYPEKDGDGFYAIEKFQLVQTGTPELDTHLPVLQ